MTNEEIKKYITDLQPYGGVGYIAGFPTSEQNLAEIHKIVKQTNKQYETSKINTFNSVVGSFNPFVCLPEKRNQARNFYDSTT